MLASGDLSGPSGWDDEWLTEVGGRAVHEIRTWIAVAAAMATLPEYRMATSFYREIPEWIAGFGLATFLGRAA